MSDKLEGLKDFINKKVEEINMISKDKGINKLMFNYEIYRVLEEMNIEKFEKDYIISKCSEWFPDFFEDGKFEKVKKNMIEDLIDILISKGCSLEKGIELINKYTTEGAITEEETRNLIQLFVKRFNEYHNKDSKDEDILKNLNNKLNEIEKRLDIHSEIFEKNLEILKFLHKKYLKEGESG